MYANGRGVPKDEVKAVGLFTQAASSGYAKAQFNLGTVRSHSDTTKYRYRLSLYM